MKGWMVSAAIIMAFLGWMVSNIEAAKPQPDPPAPEASGFACFPVQNFGNTICFDKSDQFTLRQLVADANVTEVFPYGHFPQNVSAHIDDVMAALNQ